MKGQEAYEIFAAQASRKSGWADLGAAEQAAWAAVARAAKTPADAACLTVLSSEVVTLRIRAKCAGCGHLWQFEVVGEGVALQCPTCSGMDRPKNKAKDLGRDTDVIAAAAALVE